jgi:hypothetical protein
MRRTVGVLLAASALVCGGQSSARAYSFTLTPISPLTQSWPEIDFLAPYFYFLLTNTSAQPDSFHLEITNLVPADWFPQVCLRQICYPESTTLAFGALEADTVGVNIVPFYDGVGDADFTVRSVGNPALSVTYHVTLYAGTAAVGVPVLATVPALQLSQSTPNPSSGGARIDFVLPQADRATLRVFDAGGRLLATLVDGTMTAGPHSVTWGARSARGVPLPAGAYFYRLETSQGSLARRLILVR